MKIKIGQQYMVTPYNKWRVTEEELMVGNDKQFILRMEWKGGVFLITPQNEEEVSTLQNAVDTDDNDNELVSNHFEEFEIFETTDGNDEMDFGSDFSDEEIDEIYEAYEEDWHAGLEEIGYGCEDGWFTLWGKVIAEEYVGECKV